MSNTGVLRLPVPIQIQYQVSIHTRTAGDPSVRGLRLGTHEPDLTSHVTDNSDSPAASLQPREQSGEQ